MEGYQLKTKSIQSHKVVMKTLNQQKKNRNIKHKDEKIKWIIGDLNTKNFGTNPSYCCSFSHHMNVVVCEEDK